MRINEIAKIIKEIVEKKVLLKEDFIKFSPSNKAIEIQNRMSQNDKNLLKAGYLSMKRRIQDRRQLALAYSVFVQALAYEPSHNEYRSENKLIELVDLILSQADNNFEIYYDDEFGVFHKANQHTDDSLRNYQIVLNKYRRFLKLGSELPDELRQRFMDSISLEAHRNNNNLPCEKIEECENFDEIFQFFVRMPEIRINLIYSRIVAETNSSQNQ